MAGKGVIVSRSGSVATKGLTSVKSAARTLRSTERTSGQEGVTGALFGCVAMIALSGFSHSANTEGNEAQKALGSRLVRDGELWFE